RLSPWPPHPPTTPPTHRSRRPRPRHSPKENAMKQSRFLSAAALAAVTALTLSACGGGSASADSDEPIPIGIIADLSGATGDVGTPYNEGMLSYVEHLNDNGGI